MNRSEYFNYIEKKLNILSYRIKNRGKINLLDLNIYSPPKGPTTSSAGGMG